MSHRGNWALSQFSSHFLASQWRLLDFQLSCEPSFLASLGGGWYPGLHWTPETAGNRAYEGSTTLRIDSAPVTVVRAVVSLIARDGCEDFYFFIQGLLRNDKCLILLWVILLYIKQFFFLVNFPSSAFSENLSVGHSPSPVQISYQLRCQPRSLGTRVSDG